MSVNAAQIAGAGSGVGGGIHGKLQRRHLRLAGEVAGEQLVHGDIGDDFDFIASAARGAGEERSGGAGVNVIPA